jgi:hypothetical protein
MRRALAVVMVMAVASLAAGGDAAPNKQATAVAPQAAAPVAVGGGVVVLPEPGWEVQSQPGIVVLTKNGNLWIVTYSAPTAAGARVDPVTVAQDYQTQVIAPGLSRVTTGVLHSFTPTVPSGRAIAIFGMSVHGTFAGSDPPLGSIGGVTLYVRSDGSVVGIESRLSIPGNSDPAISAETDRMFLSTEASV